MPTNCRAHAIRSQPIRFALVVFVAVAVHSFAPAQTSAPASERAVSDAQRIEHWLDDLNTLASELPKRHKNLFFRLSREEFETDVAALREALPNLSNREIVVRMMRLVARVGDAHTTLDARVALANAPQFPFVAYAFKDGVFITHATPQHEALVGAQILALDDTPIDQAIQRVGALLPAENEATRRSHIRRTLNAAALLHASGVTRSDSKVTLRLRQAGTERSLEIAAVSPAQLAIAQWVTKPSADKLPLYRQTRPRSNWFELLPGDGVLYVQYGKCQNELGQSVAEFSEAVLAKLTESGAARLVIDLRRNGGGNSALLWPFIARLGTIEQMRKPGSVIVLVGRATFSSAQLNASEIKKALDAIVIGEPTGQKPNAYGEVRSFQLPHSNLIVSYSTKYFQTATDDPESMFPDVRIEPTAAEYFAGDDPVLTHAIRYAASPTP